MYVCSLYGFQFLIHILLISIRNCLITVQCDGAGDDDDANANGKRINQYKTKGGKPK